MKMLHQLTALRSGARNFSSSEQGSAMLMVGLAATLLIASAGIAIDLGRVQVVQSRLSNSLDAAGLAAGTVVNSGDITATTIKYFNANYPSGFMGSNIQTPIVTPNADKTVLTLSVQGTVPTTFMKMFGVSSVAVSANSQITRSNKGMELVLVMDVTGSMNDSAGGGQTKIQAAKSAAHLLLSILYGNKTTIPNLWVGLVPFSQAVNIGTSAARASWTTPVPDTLNWGPAPNAWGGCVESRAAGGLDITDDPPNVLVPSTLFPKYRYPCNSDTDGGGSDNATNPWYGTNSSSSGNNPAWGNCTLGAGTQYRTPFSTSTRGPNFYCPPTLTSMTANRTTVDTAIDAMTAQGATEIVLGMAWGWRMLSDRWRGVWDGEMQTAGLPKDFNTPLMSKVVVLMTDGDNSISWDLYTAYGYPTPNNQLGPSPCVAFGGCSNGVSLLNSKTSQVCTSMKNKGIIIYTVAFGTSINNTSKNMLKNCATVPEYYFFSPDATALQQAFKQIGDSLANLRVSQ